VHGDRERLGRRKPGPELPVHQECPDVAEGDLPDEVLDVDASIAQCAAFLVRLGDLGLERDHAFEARFEVGHHALPFVTGRFLPQT
jgi:hypothetical protein